MSSDDDDELFSEEDDNYQPSGKDQFNVHRPLEPPNPKQWSIEDLHRVLIPSSALCSFPVVDTS